MEYELNKEYKVEGELSILLENKNLCGLIRIVNGKLVFKEEHIEHGVILSKSYADSLVAYRIYSKHAEGLFVKFIKPKTKLELGISGTYGDKSPIL